MKVCELQYEIDNPYNRQAQVLEYDSWEDYIKKLNQGKAGISKKCISSFIPLLNEDIKFCIIGKFTAKMGLKLKEFIHVAYLY